MGITAGILMGVSQAAGTAYSIYQSEKQQDQAEELAAKQEQAQKKLLAEAENKTRTEDATRNRDMTRARQRQGQTQKQMSGASGTVRTSAAGITSPFSPMDVLGASSGGKSLLGT